MKIMVTDIVNTPDGRVGPVSEFDEVNGRTMAKVWVDEEPAWYDLDKLQLV